MNLQVSKDVEYGLCGLILLAKRGGTMSVTEMAEEGQVPVQFLSKIFQRLKKAGIVRSTRGRSGGVSLLKAPDKVTLQEILTALDAKLELADCECCDKKKGRCCLKLVWKKAEDAMTNIFKETYLSHLV